MSGFLTKTSAGAFAIAVFVCLTSVRAQVVNEDLFDAYTFWLAQNGIVLSSEGKESDPGIVRLTGVRLTHSAMPEAFEIRFDQLLLRDREDGSLDIVLPEMAGVAFDNSIANQSNDESQPKDTQDFLRAHDLIVNLSRLNVSGDPEDYDVLSVKYAGSSLQFEYNDAPTSGILAMSIADWELRTDIPDRDARNSLFEVSFRAGDLIGSMESYDVIQKHTTILRDPVVTASFVQNPDDKSGFGEFFPPARLEMSNSLGESMNSLLVSGQEIEVKSSALASSMSVWIDSHNAGYNLQQSDTSVDVYVYGQTSGATLDDMEIEINAELTNDSELILKLMASLGLDNLQLSKDLMKRIDPDEELESSSISMDFQAEAVIWNPVFSQQDDGQDLRLDAIDIDTNISHLKLRVFDQETSLEGNVLFKNVGFEQGPESVRGKYTLQVDGIVQLVGTMVNADIFPPATAFMMLSFLDQFAHEDQTENDRFRFSIEFAEDGKVDILGLPVE